MSFRTHSNSIVPLSRRDMSRVTLYLLQTELLLLYNIEYIRNALTHKRMD